VLSQSANTGTAAWRRHGPPKSPRTRRSAGARVDHSRGRDGNVSAFVIRYWSGPCVRDEPDLRASATGAPISNHGPRAACVDESVRAGRLWVDEIRVAKRVLFVMAHRLDEAHTAARAGSRLFRSGRALHSSRTAHAHAPFVVGLAMDAGRPAKEPRTRCGIASSPRLEVQGQNSPPGRPREAIPAPSIDPIASPRDSSSSVRQQQCGTQLNMRSDLMRRRASLSQGLLPEQAGKAPSLVSSTSDRLVLFHQLLDPHARVSSRGS